MGNQPSFLRENAYRSSSIRYFVRPMLARCAPASPRLAISLAAFDSISNRDHGYGSASRPREGHLVVTCASARIPAVLRPEVESGPSQSPDAAIEFPSIEHGAEPIN